MFKWLKKSAETAKERLFWTIGGNGQVIFHGGAGPMASDDPFPSLDPQKAYKDAGLYAAHSTIAASIASMPLKLFKGDDNNKIEAKEHPVWAVLEHSPNPKQTAFEWKSWVVTELMMHRNAFCRVVRMKKDGDRVKWVLPIENARVKVQTKGDDEIRYEIRNAPADWRTVYDGQAPTGHISAPLSDKTTVYDAEDVLHFRLFATSPNVGLPLLAHGKTAIGLNILLEEIAARYIQNGGNSARFYKTLKTMSPEAQKNFLDEIGKIITGTNWGGSAVLVDGMDVHESKAESLDKQQNLESRQFGITQHARLAGIQAHLIGDLSRSTNNNIEHQGLEYVTYRLLSIGEAIEQRIEKTLLTPREQEKGYRVEFDYRNFLRGDLAAQREFIKAMWGIGAYDVDECRMELGKNPLPGGKGKVRMVPVNMIELGKEPPKNGGTTGGTN